MLSENGDIDPKKYPELALIKAVERRRPLWDPTAHFYRNSSAVKILWGEVAVLSGLTESQVKSRWKTLRDYYRIELKKRNSGKALGRRNNWTFFEAMSFLRETLNNSKLKSDESDIAKKCDTSTENQSNESILELANTNTPENQNTNLKNNTDEAHSSTNESRVAQNYQDQCKKSALCPCSSCRWAPYPTRPMRNQERIKQELDILEKKWLRQIEAKKLEILERSIRQDDDEDLLFFRSLLPSIKSLAKAKKMKLRLQFQEMLCKEIENSNE